MRQPRRKITARNEVEPESDEYFAYIAGYTAGGCPYGITWEEMRELEQAEAEVDAEPGPEASLEFSPESVVRFFARHGISAEAELKKSGLSVFLLPNRTPLARLLPVGKKSEVAELLWWSHRERWEAVGDFGEVDMPLREALQYIVDGGPGFSIF